jgi:hypothetical protein
MSGCTDDNRRGRTAASVVRHHLRRRPRYADLLDDDLDVVADRLDVVARTAREFLADYLRTDSPNVYPIDREETAVGQ